MKMENNRTGAQPDMHAEALCLNDEQTRSVSDDTPVTYKFWKKSKDKAIYISQCDGVVTTRTIPPIT